jgi:hypothetical protein
MTIEEIKSYALYIVMMVAMTALIWWVGSFFAKGLSDYEVITPKPGIECVVVSRMFNTSVDCWKVEQ